MKRRLCHDKAIKLEAMLYQISYMTQHFTFFLQPSFHSLLRDQYMNENNLEYLKHER